MPTGLKVIALVSGGKDSYYCMLQCIAQGHRIVALANLHPPLRHVSPGESQAQRDALLDDDDLSRNAFEADGMDSFMYQTAGHTLVPSQAQALGLPLFRREILGSAVDTSRDYRGPEGSSLPADSDFIEETECLTALLQDVITKHPEADAVCSGAILSTYQRTRIESIALRLGLTPLAYLWQYPVLPQSSGRALLDDMEQVGFDVRLVKVASGGLEQSLLWSSVTNQAVRSRLERIMSKYGGNILGEGGEYETVVLGGPSPIWKAQLAVDKSQMQIIGDAGGASSLIFSNKAVKLTEAADRVQASLPSLRKISLWDDVFIRLKAKIQVEATARKARASATSYNQKSGSKISQQIIKKCQCRVDSLLYISNLCSFDAGQDAAQQMARLNAEIIICLRTFGLSVDSIVFTTIILRSTMQNYTTINDVYSKLFSSPNPPARVTVSSCLPEGVQVMLSLIVSLATPTDRDGLHVQSRSYWAPANIGPYSQAIRLRIAKDISLVYIAGQIPLAPADMTLLRPPQGSTLSFLEDAILSLQHMWRIGQQMQVSFWAGAVVYIASDSDMGKKSDSIFSLWARIHEEDLWETHDETEEALDPWDVKFGLQRTHAVTNADIIPLPNFDRLIGKRQGTHPGIFTVEVLELPRNCSTEWQGLGITNASLGFEKSTIAGFNAIVCSIETTAHSFAFICIPWPEDSAQSTRDLVEKLRYDDSSFMTIYSSDYQSLNNLEAQIVPCISVWSPLGRESLAAGVVLHSCTKQGDQK